VTDDRGDDDRAAVARTSAGIDAWIQHRRAAGEVPDPGLMRSVADGAVVELREVTGENARAVMLLQVAPSQRGFVAPNAVSLGQAMFEARAWFRAVYADDTPVGFALLDLDRDGAEYTLWRFMIDDRFQGLGYGRAAIGLVVDFVRSLPGATYLATSWVPGPGSPEGFYLGLGFRPTGEMDETEIVGRLDLSQAERS
jgi:diamine N-acetyltransferase